MEAKDIISSGLLDLYAAGAASPEEAAQVTAYAQQYPEVAAELAAIEEAMESYAMANAIAPAPSVKEQLFAKIGQSIPKGDAAEKVGAPVIPIATSESVASGKVVKATAFWKIAAAASVALLVGSVAMNVSLYNKQDELAGKLDNATKDITILEREKKTFMEEMKIVQSKYSMPITLDRTDSTMEAAAKVFWMKNTGEVFIDPSNLPDAPAGMQYQLWAIIDGAPVDAGMIITTGEGNKYRIQPMKKFDKKIQAFAVSLEKELGNTSPKGKVVVVGKM